MYFKKRKYVIVVLAGLIALAVYLNVVYTDSDGMFEVTQTVSPTSAQIGDSVNVSSDSAKEVTTSKDSKLSEARLSRQKSRDEAEAILKNVIENDSLSAEDKSEAAKKLTALADAVEKEASVENLICAKGFSDCVAYISDDTINVTISADGLEKNQIAQIKEIVIAQTGISTDKIKILEIK